MERVKNDLDKKNFELRRNHPDFSHEPEATFEITDPSAVEPFRALTRPHHSVYMSTPFDEFSWRTRSEGKGKKREYTTALKDEGEMIDGVLDRIEEEETVSSATHEFYDAKPYFPKLNYDRWKSADGGIAIDFIPNHPPLLEYEKVAGQPEPELLKELRSVLVDRSDDPTVRKEYIAYERHEGEVLEAPKQTMPELVKRMVSDMVGTYVTGVDTVVVGLSGLPGSGKSTAVREVEKALVERFGEEFRPVTISTDDYHRGKKWLEETYGVPWTNWDAPEVYHTSALADDIKELLQGKSIRRRHFDFESEEVVFDEPIHPKRFVIIEGIFAGSKDLAQIRHLHYNMPTSLADCVGRDIGRLLTEDRANRAFPTPKSRLRYLAEIAVPTYLAQERPQRNSFSAHARPLADRAFLLEKLSN